MTPTSFLILKINRKYIYQKGNWIWVAFPERGVGFKVAISFGKFLIFIDESIDFTLGQARSDSEPALFPF